MGHTTFWILHIICILTGSWMGLLITIPLHLLYTEVITPGKTSRKARKRDKEEDQYEI